MKRYELWGYDCGMEEADDGEYVKYEDAMKLRTCFNCKHEFECMMDNRLEKCDNTMTHWAFQDEPANPSKETI